MARIRTKHDSFADGRGFDGVSIMSNIQVHITRSDIVTGRDRVFETALNWLQRKTRATSSNSK